MVRYQIKLWEYGCFTVTIDIAKANLRQNKNEKPNFKKTKTEAIIIYPNG